MTDPLPGAAPPAWEWRLFLPGARGIGELLPGVRLPPDRRRRRDVYLLAPGLPATRGLKLRDGELLEIKLLEERAGELERWRKAFARPLAVPPWHTRQLARLIGRGRVPVRPLRSEEDVLRFVRDVGLGDPEPVTVAKSRCKTVGPEGVRLEWTHLEVRGATWSSLCLESADGERLGAARTRVAAPEDAQVAGYPEFLTGR